MSPATAKPGLLVLASTYPRWKDDHEPGFVHELSRRLCDAFEVTVVTSHSPGAAAREVMDGVSVIRYRYAPEFMETLVYGGGMASNLRRSPWKSLLVPCFLLGQYLAARRVVRREAINAIHAHWLIPQGMVARRLASIFRIPYVVTSHGGDLFGLRGPIALRIKKAVASSAAVVTVVSNAMRDEVRRVGLAPRELTVLPMGIDFHSRFSPDPGGGREHDRLLFVGRLVPKKGLRYLLDAMPLILQRRPGVVLEIAGFGPELAALQAQSARLGIQSQVRFLGAMQQQELPALYRRAATFVAPFVRDDSGDQEGLPVSLMEAIGCGCPVVVGDVAGLSDLLGDATARISVDARDSQALAEAVLASLADVPGAERVALDIKRSAMELLDWKRISKAYEMTIIRAVQVAAHG
jgi:glycosyltransferase involved in cell wall biosynthesis